MELIMHIKLWKFFFAPKKLTIFSNWRVYYNKLYEQIIQFDFEKWIGFISSIILVFSYNNAHFMVNKSIYAAALWG